MKDMDIVEVSRQSGVPASTLRFYEEKGLIASIGRRGMRRLFDSGVLERLALIALGRTASFSRPTDGRGSTGSALRRRRMSSRGRFANSAPSVTASGTPPPAPHRVIWNARGSAG